MNQVVLITGCSSGFGYLTALTFAKNGWKVYGTLRDLKSPVANELQEAGVTTLYLDVTQEKSIIEAIQVIKSNEKTLDVLVNNAGVGFLGPVEEFSTEETKKQFDINFFGVHRMIQEVLPVMRKQRFGKIINVSSMAARSTTALYGIYSATKVALEAMSEALNIEVSKWGISVSLIEPASFATHFGKNIKLPKEFTESSPYAELVSHYKGIRAQLDADNKNVSWLRNPQRVVDLIYKVARTKHPKLRYFIGAGALLIILSTVFIPYKLRLWALRAFYKW